MSQHIHIHLRPGYRPLLALMMLAVILVGNAQGQTSAFNYQGRLTDAGNPATGIYDFQFKLFDAASAGNQIGATQTLTNVQTDAGTFSVQLDFGAMAFQGADRFLEISISPAGQNNYVTLSPRQRINSAPYSISARKAMSADSLSGDCILCVTDARIQSVDGSKVAGTVASAATATNVSGVVQIANGGTGSSTKNFVDLTTNQTNIGGDKTFTGAVGVSGANGVFNGNGSGLINLNGANITGGSVTSAQLSADALPNSSSLKLLGSLRWDLLKGQDTFNVGVNPEGIAFDGANIWIANSGIGNVTKLRASDGANLGTFFVGGAIAIAFDGANMWITKGSTNVVKLRASDGADLGTFAVGGSTYGIAFDGANVWVANNSGSNVTKLRASDGVNLGTFPVGSVPKLIAFDGANVWIVNSSSNNVTKLRASDGANLGTFSVGSNPYGIAFDGANIWVSNNNSTNVTKLRASDGANLGTFPVGTGPEGIAFDGANMWIANGFSNNVIKLRASDGANLGTFPVGSFPAGIAFDGTNMWVANYSGNTVTRLPPAFPQ